MAESNKEPAAGRSEDRPFLDFEYLYNSWVGRFKIVEFFASLLAGCLVPATVSKHAAGFTFMSFVAWTTFLNVIIDIILHLVRLWERLLFVHQYPQVLVCLCFLGSVSFLVASLVLVGISQYAASSGLGYASALFGFICCAVLALECFLHYKSYREKQQQPSREMSNTASAGVQDPNFY